MKTEADAMTNFEKITNCSEEEIVEMIDDMRGCEYCTYKGGAECPLECPGGSRRFSATCREGIRLWLREEAAGAPVFKGERQRKKRGGAHAPCAKIIKMEDYICQRENV